MTPAGGASPRSADWLDRLWEDPDLAPAPAVRQQQDNTPACVGKDLRIFFPKPWELTSGTAEPSEAERTALAVCAGCTVQSWCLMQDLAQCSTESKIIGVRGGLRQSDRRALHRLLVDRGLLAGPAADRGTA